MLFSDELCRKQPLATSLLASAVERDRIANAYLLSGGDKEDKLDLARHLACHLNCESDWQGSCLARVGGTSAGDRAAQEEFCRSCRWIVEGKHPKAWITLVPAESASRVSVESARNLSEELARTATDFRVVVVENASQEVFHRPAANALLKTIEEPKSACVFFFLAPAPENVLTTIVSRCQVVPVIMAGPESAGPLYSCCRAGGSGSAPVREAGEESNEQLARISESGFFNWPRSLGRDGSRAPQRVSAGERLELAGLLTDLTGQVDYRLVIDTAYLEELSIIGSKAVDQPRLAEYLRQLLTLAEETKQLLDRYVTRKAAMETFVLKWSRLREAVITRSTVA